MQFAIGIDMRSAEREGPAGIAARQSARLLQLVRFARANSPLYRGLYQDVPVRLELRDLPPTTKPQLMSRFDEWVTDRRVTAEAVTRFMAEATAGERFLGEYFVCTSSGTTGHPGTFVHDRRALAFYRAAAVARLNRRWLPARDWPALLRHRMRLVSVVGTGAHFAGAAWTAAERERSVWRRHAYSTVSIHQPLAQIVAELNRLQPGILITYPSALVQLAAEQSAGRLVIDPVFIEATGETLPREVAQSATEVFGCPVRQAYAASEALVMAISCDAGWMHVNADWVVLEPVDAELRPTPPGEASHTVLLTNLANRVQPIIRYDVGDSVQLRVDRCPCGNPLPAIRVQGRCDDVLHLRASTGECAEILPLAVGTLAQATPGVDRWQLVQTAPAQITVHLATVPGYSRELVWEDLRSRLSGFLQAQSAGFCALVLSDQPPERSATSGKFRQVISAPAP